MKEERENKNKKMAGSMDRFLKKKSKQISYKQIETWSLQKLYLVGNVKCI